MTKAKIIVVEDESITAFDLQTRLQGMGYIVPAIASSGDDALSMVKEHLPDLILMDIRIRGEQDGIEVAQKIRESFDIPIIYLTAFADDATIKRARITEPFGYLLKPFQEQELYSSVEMALYKHKAEKQLREDERRLQIYSERLQTLHSIEQAILGADSPRDISQTALHSIGKLVPCQSALVITVDNQLHQASVLAGFQNEPSQQDTLTFSIQGDAFYQSMQVGDKKIIRAAELYYALPGVENIISDNEITEYTIVPLLSQDDLIGGLILGTTPTQRYEETQLDIIRELANSLALAIHHSSLHQELANYADELAQRNVDLDAFAHTVAHDLKSPISVITGFSEVLAEDIHVAPRENLGQFIDIISRTADKMNDIVNELLLLAEVRKQDVQVSQVDMAEIVNKALSRLHYTISKTSAEVDLPTRWPSVLGYGPWVEEVWINYINNALKYGGNPPKIWLGANEVVDPGTGGIFYRFWIRDNGEGIPQDVQKELFTPFTRIDQVRAQGHGLGLSIVHRIIEKLGGTVGVESEGLAGEGSLFYFTLPSVGGEYDFGVDNDGNA